MLEGKFLRFHSEPNDCFENAKENAMKKLACLGLLVVTSTGCGCFEGWMPFRALRGAPCRAGICGAGPLAAPANAGCNTCPHGTGYSDYENGEMVGGSGYLDGGIIHDGATYGGSVSGGSVGGTTVTPGGNTLPPPSMGNLRTN